MIPASHSKTKLGNCKSDRLSLGKAPSKRSFSPTLLSRNSRCGKLQDLFKTSKWKIAKKADQTHQKTSTLNSSIANSRSILDSPPRSCWHRSHNTSRRLSTTSAKNAFQGHTPLLARRSTLTTEWQSLFLRMGDVEPGNKTQRQKLRLLLRKYPQRRNGTHTTSSKVFFTLEPPHTSRHVVHGASVRAAPRVKLCARAPSARGPRPHAQRAND